MKEDLSSVPFQFSLTYADYPERPNTLFSEEKGPIAAINIQLKAERKITFNQSNNKTVSNDHFHFYLKLGKNQQIAPLKENCEQKLKTKDWTYKIKTEDESYDYIFFLYQGNKALSYSFENPFSLEIFNLIIKNDLKYKGTFLQIHFNYIKHSGLEVPSLCVSEEGKQDVNWNNSSETTIDLAIEKLDKKAIFPFVAQWINVPNVLNDGRTENTLSLRLFNSSEYNSLNFNQNATIAIQVNNDDETGLSSDENIKNIKIDFKRGKENTRNDWTLSPLASFVNRTCILSSSQTDIILQPSDYIDIEFSEIVTDYLSGTAMFVLNYSGFVGFPDGQITVPVQKASLYCSNNIGVGTTTPTAKLDVNGTLNVTEKASFDDDVEIQGSLSGKEGKLNINDQVNFQKEIKSLGCIDTSEKIKEEGNELIPKGTIVMWNGSTAPKGWSLCDKTNGTPDLRGRFIVGYNPNDSDYNLIEKSGGEKEVTLTKEQMPKHSHSSRLESIGIRYWKRSFEGSNGSPNTMVNGNEDGCSPFSDLHSFETGGDKPHENRPPYFVLAYIMKL
ncbi:hypothetical protein CXF68_01225 [Tenacibaculum sp. Bg11-29]|uniref:phage baseplate protein n=1 Tax=Tenacibaculum sp. Bg11-29 TaxID=2058306 RepID=UPI000C32DD2D|nr:hypothetical protein [Tenacibaculum sp. Bg11-29]PKH49390.1 hypothetical protein CXF68_01225 [Tenacibaculum sp. Bg11-29]